MVNVGDGVYLPGSYAEGQVVSSGVSIPANNRVLCIVGEGTRREVIVNFAAGGGNDGWNSTYTLTTSGTDGRHFALSNYPLVSNRLTLLKNGIPLTGVEDTIDTNTFSALYDYRVDISLGHIELQSAHLVDQGGAYYTAYGTNVGDGYITSLTLLDDAAPTETWTLRCNTVRRDIYGQPIDGYAQFVLNGSVSGIVLDGYGSPVVWKSDGVTRNNGMLEFAISEGLSAFEIGDTFTMMVTSGVLLAGDNLTAEYIAELDINDPELFTDMNSLTGKHGLPSLTNTISLGAQLAFANAVPGILCCQAAPSIPRRVWYTVQDQASGTATPDDLKFVLPPGVNPSTDSVVKFLIVNTTTGAETEIRPNKVDFYNPTIEANPDLWIMSASAYSYTVIQQYFILHETSDLVVTPIAGGGPVNYNAWVSSPTVTFDLTDYTAGMKIHIYDSTHATNNGTWSVTAVSGGRLKITRADSVAFITETAVNFREYDTSSLDVSAYVLLTQDLALTSTQGLKVGVIDTKDASFYDANWSAAFEKLEAFDLDILVPLPTSTKSAVIAAALQHCLSMSRLKNRKERVLFTGAIQGLLPNNVTGVTPAAVEDIGVLEGIQGDDPAEILAGNTEDLTNYSVPDAFGGTYRVVYHYPDRVVVSLQGTNTYVDGMYMAAAHGGYLSNVGNVAIPSTNKTLAGFSILRDRTYSTTVAEQIVAAGITLLQPVLGGGRIVWGKTTSQSGYSEEEEISIVFIRDKVAKSCRAATQGFIGQAESPSFPISLQARINSLCLGFVSQGLITKFDSIMVKRDSVDPRQWNITFKVQPVYPVNWISIKFTLGLI